MLSWLNNIINTLSGLESASRKRLRRKPFPEHWELVLQRDWPLWKSLKPSTIEKIKEDILVFTGEKIFEGCRGLKITDQMKVLTAAQAVLLIQGGISDFYPTLNAVLMYPTKYKAKVNNRDASGIVSEGTQWRAGESWSGGNVVLAWDEVMRGAANSSDARNLVFHEFAHQIDTDLGITSKTEAWTEARAEPDSEWIKLYSEEFMDFLETVQHRRQTIFDTYGSQNAAEFFAVVTESFIEQHQLFRQRHPRLFTLFTELYGFDPAKL